MNHMTQYLDAIHSEAMLLWMPLNPVIDWEDIPYVEDQIFAEDWLF